MDLKRKEYLKEYYKKNKDRIKKYYDDNREHKIKKVKERADNNKEKISEYQKKYTEKNKECKKIYNENYRKENKEKIKEYKEVYYEENIEKIKEYQRSYRSNRLLSDNLFKLSKNIRTLIVKSFKENGYKKTSKTFNIVGCSFEEFKLYLESKFEPWMNWDNYGLYNGEFNNGWDIDHIIPTISANSEEEIFKLNHYDNLQPLCSKVNRYIKKDIIDDTKCLFCDENLINRKYCNDRCKKNYYYKIKTEINENKKI